MIKTVIDTKIKKYIVTGDNDIKSDPKISLSLSKYGIQVISINNFLKVLNNNIL